MGVSSEDSSVSKWPKWLRWTALFQLVAWMAIIGIMVYAILVSLRVLSIMRYPWEWATQSYEWYLFWLKIVGYGFLPGTPQVEGH
jgi:hypothetical protein